MTQQQTVISALEQLSNNLEGEGRPQVEQSSYLPAKTEYEQHAEAVILACQAKKLEIRGEFAKREAYLAKLNQEQQEVWATGHRVKQRIAELNAPSGHLRDARVRAIADGLMGGDVDRSKLEYGGFADTLTASQLKEGLDGLAEKSRNLTDAISKAKGSVEELRRELLRQHAVESGARFMLLRDRLVNEYANILACEKTLKQRDSAADARLIEMGISDVHGVALLQRTPQVIEPEFEFMTIPSADTGPGMDELRTNRFGSSKIQITDMNAGKYADAVSDLVGKLMRGEK